MNDDLRGLIDQMLKQGTPGAEALFEIRKQRNTLASQVSAQVELPEPAGVLEIREGDDVRTYKHILQSSLLHREHYAVANRIKHLYLLDAFMRAADDENPMALYAIARSMFEFSAFLHEVRNRLKNTAASVNDKTWQPLGMKFFGLIVRARYATANPEFRTMLLDSGIPTKRLKPYNITYCVRGLASEPERADAEDRYAVLCDFVHHNLGSTTTANSGIRYGTTANNGAGSIVTQKVSPIIRYEYPVVGKFSRDLDGVAVGFLQDAIDCIRWDSETPHSPFPVEMNVRVTGSALGIPLLPSTGNSR